MIIILKKATQTHLGPDFLTFWVARRRERGLSQGSAQKKTGIMHQNVKVKKKR